MKILIFLLYIITTSLTISYAQSNCVPHQIILLFKNDPTTLYQQALSDPDCLAASTCVDLHPFAQTGRHTSDCGETVSALIERFKDHPELELCEPNHYKQTCNTLPIETALPNDPLFKNQWSLHNTRQQPISIAGADINFIEAQSLLKHLSPTSTPSVVGVIDSGFDISHPDLKNNLWNNPSEIPDNGIDDDGNGYIDDNHGYDFINNSGDLSRTSAEIANHGNSDPYYSLSIPNAQTSLDSILINSQENKLIQHHFHTIQDLQYTLQFNAQLNEINWNNKTEPYAGTGNRATISTPIDDNSEAGFYRLKIDPPTL